MPFVLAGRRPSSCFSPRWQFSFQSMNETSRIAKSVASKRATRCRHFNGVQHDKCEAGVCYETLEASGLLPCLPWHCDSGKPVAKCDKYATYTAEEIAQQERELERSLNGTIVARKAIVDELNRRNVAADKTVVAKPHHDPEFSETGCQSPYVAGACAMPCPVCKSGTLRYSRAACNGHIHARCSTEGCVSWME